MHVLGTAGHVDHGKSAFLRCLTGMEPDRLPAEKKTGMTIDLNFVWFDAKNGERIGIVDVPGHKRFVKNMISGVMNVDAFLFIVAADDGWMPQSEEHLEVLAAMGIRRGLVLITKTDLVDGERANAVRDDVVGRLKKRLEFEVESYFFSALMPENLETIRSAVEGLVAALPQTGGEQAVGRLWVDRVFTPKGKGVVVTGTLREGKFCVGDEVELLPQRKMVVIKGLQSYKANLETAEPVSRVAVQLGKVEASEVARGSLLQKLKHIPLSSQFDACIRFFTRTKMKNLELPVHLGTSRVPALIIPLEIGDPDTLVRVKPRSPLPLRSGDRFLLRTPGEEKNCGGGIVIDPLARTKSHREAVSALKQWEDSVRGFVKFRSEQNAFLRLDSLWEESIYSREQLKEALAAHGHLEVETGVFAKSSVWETLSNETVSILSACHQSGLDSVPLHELRGRFGSLPEESDLGLVVEALIESGKLERRPDGLKLRGHQQVLDPWEQKIWALLSELFRQECRPVRPEEFGEDAAKMRGLMQRLVKQGHLVALAEDHFFGSEAYETLKAKVTAHLKANSTASTSELRTLLNTSRKYAVLFLERMDRDRVTFLKDGVRKLLQ